MTLIFSIETSCDETSVAILHKSKRILGEITHSQSEHIKYGGVVPEIASRAHLEILQKIIPKCFKKAGVKIKDIDIFCATGGPGLIGGLLIGTTIAKSMAISMKKPFYGINHLEGHIISPTFNNEIKFPYLSILLTGGHTQIYLVNKFNDYKILGESVDDALGECFDKVAKLLGLKYPGGPEIEKLASLGNQKKYQLPHPLIKNKKDLNFSFSGIKTAISLIVKSQKKINKNFKKDLAASFQNKVIEILIEKIHRSLNFLKKNDIEVKDITIVGGVAANKAIRKALNNTFASKKYNLAYPLKKMCGDNAMMIGLACIEKYKKKEKPNYFFKANPRLEVNENIK